MTSMRNLHFCLFLYGYHILVKALVDWVLAREIDSA
jgi:hypothetical protein